MLKQWKSHFAMECAKKLRDLELRFWTGRLEHPPNADRIPHISPGGSAYEP